MPPPGDHRSARGPPRSIVRSTPCRVGDPHGSIAPDPPARLAVWAPPASLCVRRPTLHRRPLRAGGSGHDVNRWVGGDRAWSDATKWSRSVVPGTSATRDYACIPGRAPTSSLTQSRPGSTSRPGAGTGRDARLRPGTALYLWADQNVVRSITQMDSLIELDGATLGGGGRLHVIGTLDATIRRRLPRRADHAPRGLVVRRSPRHPRDRRRGPARRPRARASACRGTTSSTCTEGTAARQSRPGRRPRHDVHAATALLRHGPRRLVVLNDGDFAVGRTARPASPDVREPRPHRQARLRRNTSRAGLTAATARCGGLPATGCLRRGRPARPGCARRECRVRGPPTAGAPAHGHHARRSPVRVAGRADRRSGRSRRRPSMPWTACR